MRTAKGLNESISKKRTTRDERVKWVKAIIDISLKLIEKEGKFVKISNLKTRPKRVPVKSLDIMYITPFNKLPGEKDQSLIDIWQKNEGKVFSVRWEPLEIVNFKRGKWLHDLFGEFKAGKGLKDGA